MDGEELDKVEQKAEQGFKAFKAKLKARANLQKQ